ncbi:MAG: hypothetical protein R2709_13615 [Marmoricola sp.]
MLDALVDRDAPVLERWTDMTDGDGAVVWDSRIGGIPTTVIGIESRPYQASSGRWLTGGVLHLRAHARWRRLSTLPPATVRQW